MPRPAHWISPSLSENGTRMPLKLYFHPLSSFCQKVLIALYENDTAFEPISSISSIQRRRGVQGDVADGQDAGSARQSSDRTSPELSIVIEYLDQYYPGRRGSFQRIPTRLQTRMCDRFFDHYVQEPMRKIVAENCARRARAIRSACKQAKAQLRTAYDLIEQTCGQDLGDGRRLHVGRLRRRARALLCQQGRAFRERTRTIGLFRSADGARVLRARAQGSGALFRPLPLG